MRLVIGDGLAVSNYLSSHARPVEDLLNKSFHIPTYQRRYSWENPQFKSLWDDIVHSAKAIKHSKPNVKHFGGPMVFHVDQKIEPPRTWIVDGQQRLTTFYIYLAALKAFAENPHLIVLTSQRMGDDSATPFLRLNYGEESFLEILSSTAMKGDLTGPILKQFKANRTATKSNKGKTLNATDNRLYKAFCFFHKEIKSHLKDVKDTEQANNLEDEILYLHKALVNSFQILEVEVSDDETIFEVFEGLNAKGLPLNQSDLLKNRLLQADRKGSEKTVLENWDLSLSHFSNEAGLIRFPEFLQMNMKPRLDPAGAKKCTSSRLYSTFCENIDRREKPLKAHEYAEKLATAAACVGPLLNAEAPDYAPETPESYHSRNLLLLKFKWAYAPLVALGSLGEFNTTSRFKDLLKLCHNFTARYALYGRDSNASFISIMDEASRLIFQENASNKRVAEYFAGESSDLQFKKDLADYEVNKNELGYYTIMEIDRFRSGKREGMTPYGQNFQQHLEHIIPVSLEQEEGAGASDWREMKRCWNEHDSHSGNGDISKHIRKLGNLLILEGARNSKIKDSGWDTKIGSYRHSSTVDDSELKKFATNEEKVPGIDKNEWHFGSVMRRTNYLVETFATEVWSLNPDDYQEN